MEEGDSNIKNNCSVVGDDGRLCPIIIITMPPASHHHHNNFTPSNQNLSLPPPSSNSGTSSPAEHPNPTTGCFFMEITNHSVPSSSSAESFSTVKAKIMAHPLYQRLLAAYSNCQKVGASPEVVTKIEEACASAGIMGSEKGRVGEDPLLDQFMESYCEMLMKYEQELSKTFKEAIHFLQRIEFQFKTITLSPPHSSVFTDPMARNASSEDDVMGYDFNNPLAEDKELKNQLLRKYSVYLSNLKQEFMKKRKKGKLPKEAMQQLLDWWGRHSKWPYPSESQKLALRKSTGLDQMQINNWFINQRRWHWKPTEDMQFVVMDAAYHHQYYLDSVLAMGNSFPMDTSCPQLL